MHVCIDIELKHIDWLTLSKENNLRSELIKEIRKTLLASINPKDCVHWIQYHHIQLYHEAMHMDDVVQYIYAIDDAIYSIQHPCLHQRIFLGVGIYMLKDCEDVMYGMANAHFAQIQDIDAPKLHTHIALYDHRKRNHCMKEHHLVYEMRKALSMQQFDFVLQPKIPLSKHRKMEAEALLRCPSLDIPCFKLIQLAEANGMIRDLDLFIFQKVCAFQQHRLSQQLPLFTISVNLSRVHFEDSDFFQSFISIFELYKIPHTCISFEITESIVHHYEHAMKHVLSLMKDYGFTCALDDFGCGASSLYALHDLDIQAIKIDRQFFLSKTKRSNVLLESILWMAKELKLEVIAEGVETRSQARFLKHLGCDYIQSYLYAKPLLQEDMHNFYNDWKKRKHFLF